MSSRAYIVARVHDEPRRTARDRRGPVPGNPPSNQWATRRQSAPPLRDAGYSLIEMLVSLGVLGLLLAGVYSVLFQSQATFEAQQDDVFIRQQARVGVDKMATELRLAGYDMGNLDDPIESGTTSSLTFVADIDDGDSAAPCGNAFETATDGGAERVAYEVTGGELLRTVDCWDGSSWSNEYADQVVVRNVQTPQPVFRYFDDEGNEITPGGGGLSASQREDVRVVQIDLDLLDTSQEQIVGESSNPEFRITKRIKLRNAG